MKKFENMHIGAVEICKILQQNGYQAFIVGGCVRDLLLNTIPKDFDICTNAKPEIVIQLFPNNYPTGLQHGTVTVAMGKGVNNHFEVTTFRVEGKYSDGRRPEEVAFVDKIEDDLSRRDLTINAIAYDPIKNVIIDPFNGQEDIKNKYIRAVGDPNLRFQEDGLRIMRAARFAARFGYNIDPNTMKGMKNNISILKLISKERIREEFTKILMSNNPSLGFNILKDCNAIEIVCPLLLGSTFFLKNGELETKLAFLYTNYPINKIKNELLTLKFSNKEIKKTIFLLELMRLFNNYLNSYEKSAYIQFIAKMKNELGESWQDTYNQFIILMHGYGYEVLNLCEPYNNVVVWSRKEMNINGDDLLALGISPGPEIKRRLDLCYEEILINPENNIKNILIQKQNGL